MNRFMVKYFLLIAFVVFMLFLSNDYGLIDIQKTAIIVSAGIDKVEKGFSLTTQIAVPQSSTEGQKVEALAVTGEGETIASALKDINAKTSWQPNLLNCKVLIVGEELAREDVFEALDFFFRNEYFSDSCLVAVCEGSAKELLNTSTPINDINSLALQKILSKDAEKSGNAISITLKDFAISHYSAKESSVLPYLKIIPQEPDSSNSGGGQQQSSGESGQSSPQSTEHLYTANYTMLFNNGVGSEILNPTQTFAVNGVINQLRFARLNVDLSTLQLQDGDLNFVCLAVNNSKGESELSIKNGLPCLNVKVTVKVALADSNDSQSLLRLSTSNIVEEEILQEAERQFENEVRSAFELARSCDCDIYNIKKSLYQYHYDDYYRLKDSILENCLINVDVTMSDMK